ncbi:hypothetical protein MKW98_020864 [Papaver atlanticum]|uniref:Uncharacterized protein n=1 Tax=Papaver atlanticum TaxID=357466 RepID=A0AAD4XWG2_9MAGN|nr:hypothetical protein MKW98_020864 [Papaver atlanticum]
MARGKSTGRKAPRKQQLATEPEVDTNLPRNLRKRHSTAVSNGHDTKAKAKPASDEVKKADVFEKEIRFFWKETLQGLKEELEEEELEQVLLDNISSKEKLKYCIELVASQVCESLFESFVRDYEDYARNDVEELTVRMVNKQLEFNHLENDIKLLNETRTSLLDLTRQEKQEFDQLFKKKADKEVEIHEYIETLTKQKVDLTIDIYLFTQQREDYTQHGKD